MTERYTDELRNARLARGIELKDVARATRISIRVLEAIESGNLQILPPAYSRAFLRDYAMYLGVDATRILAAYDAETPRSSSAPLAPHSQAPSGSYAHEPAPSANPDVPRRMEPMKPPRVKRVDTNLTAVIAIGIVFFTGFVLVYFFLTGDTNEKKIQTVTTQAPPPPIVPQYTPSAPQTKKVADTTKPADTAKSATTPTFSEDSLTLEATTADSVWMSVVADTAHVQRGVVQKGTHLVWHAKGKFLLTIGNSKLVALSLNGKHLAANDSTSRVLRNVVITGATTTLTTSEPIPAPPPKQVVKSPQQQPRLGARPTATPQKNSPAVTPAKPIVKPNPNAAASVVKKQSVQQKPVQKKIKLRPFPDTIKKVPIK